MVARGFLLGALLVGCSSDPGAPAAAASTSGAEAPPSAPGTPPPPPSDPAVTPAAKVPCPAGMTDRWACDGASRVRCVDGYVESVACASGCVPGAEAVCSCGTNASFSHWNCGSDGDLHACAGGDAWLDRSCGGAGCDAAPDGVSDTCKLQPTDLQATITALGAKCGTASTGTTCGIAARDLVTGELAHFRGTTPYVSASSAKAIWVAAALYDGSVADVEPHAHPIFQKSDNSESGLVIDLLASPARVNTFMWQDIGIPDSGFCNWSFDKTRHASNCPSTMGGDNFFTADDAVMFLSALWDRSLLGDAKSTAELGWMTESPRTGYGGWMGTRLPPAALPTMHHKAGWLPPDVVPGYASSNDIGVVEIPGGHAYAVALLLDGAPSQAAYDDAQLPLLEKASCVVYHAVAKDAADPLGACGL